MANRQTMVTLCNMCMIYDKRTQKVLVLDKKKKETDFYGYTFCGGHIESNESLLQSTIREVKEETGLTVSHLQLCGIINWDNLKMPERMMIFLYRTSTYSGSLKSSKEGNVFWLSLEEFKQAKLAPDMEIYLQLFLHDEYFEAYGTYRDNIYSDLQVL